MKKPLGFWVVLEVGCGGDDDLEATPIEEPKLEAIPGPSGRRHGRAGASTIDGRREHRTAKLEPNSLHICYLLLLLAVALTIITD